MHVLGLVMVKWMSGVQALCFIGSSVSFQDGGKRRLRTFAAYIVNCKVSHPKLRVSPKVCSPDAAQHFLRPFVAR
jgi:hypothetical protein